MFQLLGFYCRIMYILLEGSHNTHEVHLGLNAQLKNATHLQEHAWCSAESIITGRIWGKRLRGGTWSLPSRQVCICMEVAHRHDHKSHYTSITPVSTKHQVMYRRRRLHGSSSELA